MHTAHSPVEPGPRRVRRGVWVALVVALLGAFALPALTLWHASHSALAAQACVWPAAPHVGQTAHVVVTLPNATDRSAVAGSWGRVVAQWDMVTMTMGQQRAAVSGTSAHDGAFDVPVQLDMAGPWRIEVALQAPGRPDWRTALDVHVSDTPTPAAAGAAPPGDASTGCGLS